LSSTFKRKFLKKLIFLAIKVQIVNFTY